MLSASAIIRSFRPRWQFTATFITSTTGRWSPCPRRTESARRKLNRFSLPRGRLGWLGLRSAFQKAGVLQNMHDALAKLGPLVVGKEHLRPKGSISEDGDA